MKSVQKNSFMHYSCKKCLSYLIKIIEKKKFLRKMGQQACQAIRLGDYIDAYVTQIDHKFVHYFANPTTAWKYGRQELASNAMTKAAVIRTESSIDGYYVNDSKELIHIFMGEWNSWVHQSEPLDTNVAYKQPACVRMGDYIDLYYWRQNGELIHRHASINTQWQYSEPHAIAWGGGNSLFALRTSWSAIDVYYELNNQLHHVTNGQWTNWNPLNAVTFEGTPAVKLRSPIRATRNGDWIDVFYISTDNRVCQVQCNPNNNMQHTFIRYIQGPRADRDELSVVRMGQHIDLYYISNNTVFHTYSGIANQWAWSYPEPISDSDALSGLCAVRAVDCVIDVFYVTGNYILRSLNSGVTTNYDWSRYQYGSSEVFNVQPYTSNRWVMDWNQLSQNYGCTLLAQGWNGMAFLTSVNGQQCIAKKYKKPDVGSIHHEIKVLDRLNQIHPGVFICELTEGGRLVGFVMKKFSGETVDSLIKRKKISSAEKMSLIISFAKSVRKLQKLGICHSDLHTQNLLVSGKEINIIDYGNAIIFDQNTQTDSGLTGTDFLRPPQYYKGRYCPIGVNSFQFARIAINIWTGKTFQQFWQLKNSDSQIEEINRHEKGSKFFKPIIKFLKITNPYERIITSKFIESLRAVQVKYLPVQKPQIPIHHVSFMSSPNDGVNNAVQAIKPQNFLSRIKDFAYLAHYLGFAWCGRYNIGQGFYLSQRDQNSYTFTTKPQDKVTVDGPRYCYYYYCAPSRPMLVDYGYRINDRLKIKFSHIRTQHNQNDTPRFGNPHNIEEVILDQFRGYLNNTKGTEEAEKQSSIQLSSQRKIEVSKQTTNSYKLGLKVQTKLVSPLNIFGGVEMKVALNNEYGYSASNASSQGNTKTIKYSQKITRKVLPGRKVDLQARLVGYKARVKVDFKVTMVFAVTFEGFMRAQDGGGSFHRDGRHRDTITYTLGSQNQSICSQLRSQSQNESISIWRWNDMYNTHPQARRIVEKLCDQSNYKQQISMVVKGVNKVEIYTQIGDEPVQVKPLNLTPTRRNR